MTTKSDTEMTPMCAVLAAMLLGSQSEAVTTPDECEHRIRVGLNDSCSVCLVCRSRIEEPTPYAIYFGE